MKSSMADNSWRIGKNYFFVKIDFNQFIRVSYVYNLKTHTFFSVICGVSFFIFAMYIVNVYSVLTSSIIISLENVSYIVS